MDADDRPALVIVGNPENRRVGLFQEALAEARLPAARVVPWIDLLTGRRDVRTELPPESVVRLDSPGENDGVEREFVARGAESEGHEGGPLRRALVEHGRIWHPRWWYLGLHAVLSSLAEVPCRWTSHPDEIATLFDKSACHRRLVECGVPVPAPLPRVSSYEPLRAAMRAARTSRVFVKLRWGSSASGVVALRAGSRGVIATTSVELARCEVGTKLFNSLRVRRYEDERDVAELIDALCAEGVHVERWVPKAGLGGSVFDLRIVVIDGEPRHAVVRTSRGPLTNLHLGNRRGDLKALRQRLPAGSWESIEEACRGVAAAFPRCLSLGVDVALTPSLKSHCVLEVNAFGDLLPGVLHRGEDTYGAQVRALVERGGVGPSALGSSSMPTTRP